MPTDRPREDLPERGVSGFGAAGALACLSSVSPALPSHDGASMKVLHSWRSWADKARLPASLDFPATGAGLEIALLWLPRVHLHVIVIGIGWNWPEPAAQRVGRRTKGKSLLSLVDHDRKPQGP